ncbi:hypothetical protein BS78_08G100800 [Paspalum vaginatum]|nr:hypothetical protein BS78_08G100800 [Paspalum vaginatum]
MRCSQGIAPGFMLAILFAQCRSCPPPCLRRRGGQVPKPPPPTPFRRPAWCGWRRGSDVAGRCRTRPRAHTRSTVDARGSLPPSQSLSVPPRTTASDLRPPGVEGGLSGAQAASVTWVPVAAASGVLNHSGLSPSRRSGRGGLLRIPQCCVSASSTWIWHRHRQWRLYSSIVLLK